eukprot:5339650-Pyramimonas_sp.AAC.1
MLLVWRRRRSCRTPVLSGMTAIVCLAESPSHMKFQWLLLHEVLDAALGATAPRALLGAPAARIHGAGR